MFRKLLQHDTEEAFRLLCDNMKMELDALRNKKCDETGKISTSNNAIITKNYTNCIRAHLIRVISENCH